MSIAGDIRGFIEGELLDGRALHGQDPLAAGLLDSLALEQLIVFLEDRFDIVLNDDELVAERFASVSKVAGLVRDKRRRR
jgi:hypothetical protein